MANKDFCRMTDVRLSRSFAALIIVLFLALSTAVCAEEISYAGDGESLQTLPSWLFDSRRSLFPGTDAAPLFYDNDVTVNYNPADTGVTNPEFIIGGLSESQETANNSVILIDGRADKSILGGFSQSGNVMCNLVLASGGGAERDIYGGWSFKGAVVSNVVRFSEAIVGQNVIGGVSGGGAAAANNVIVSSGSIGGSVLGGRSDNGRAENNRVVIDDGIIKDGVFGGWSTKGDAIGNAASIVSGIVGGSVYGAWGAEGDTVNNTVVVYGGTIIGGVYGGDSLRGNANDNVVTINGGGIDGIICGGFSRYGGDAAGNAVIINYGFTAGCVYGGRSDHGDAINNTVTISGRPELEKAHIWGGKVLGKGDAFTGNTLNFKSSGVSVKGVSNFEYYNFNLPQDLAAGGVMLRVVEQVNFKGATIEVALPDGGKLNKGDNIALIHSDGGISNAPKNKSCQAQQSGVLYEFSIYTDGNNLWAQVTKVGKAAK